MQHVGRVLVIAGIAVAVVGGLLMIVPRMPWLGKLPGDILIEKKHVTFYFPLATGLLISVLLTLLFWIFGRR